MKKWNSYLKPPKDGETYEAHHLNMIKLISRMVNGLNLKQRTAVYKHLGRRYGLYTGNDPRNKVNLTFDSSVNESSAIISISGLR